MPQSSGVVGTWSSSLSASCASCEICVRIVLVATESIPGFVDLDEGSVLCPVHFFHLVRDVTDCVQVCAERARLV